MINSPANGAAAAISIDVDIDRAIGFTIPARHARGRLVRLGPVLDLILANHAYPPVLAELLAQALVLTALLGSTLKDAAGQLTLQAQTAGGAIDLMVCDYRGGEMRGYLRHDRDIVAQLPPSPTLADLFGKGYLAITFDQAVTGERYQGIVPLEGGSLADAAESYFAQSEQIPSLVRLAVADIAGGRIAGGLMLQHLPEGEEGRERIHTRLDHPEWEHVAVLGQTVTPAELVDPALPMEQLIWRLFNEEGEVRVLSANAIAKGCRCDLEHIRSVLARFPDDERGAMAEADGMIHVDCAFCARDFAIDPVSVAA